MIWRIKRSAEEHNHELSDDMGEHPTARRLTTEQQEKRLHLEQAGIKPKEQLAFRRREYEIIRAVQQDIYNEKQKKRKEFLKGRTSIQALVDLLHDSGYGYDVKYNADGNVSHLLFARPSLIAMLRQYHSVLQFDCTYKANKFKPPLLLCIGLAPSNNSFMGCAVFMRKEEQSDYEWALQAVQRLLYEVGDPSVILSDNEAALLNAMVAVFPNSHRVLCRWHVNNNILKNCRKYFPVGVESSIDGDWDCFLDLWQAVCASKIGLTFDNEWKEFHIRYRKLPKALNYLESTRLCHKQKLISVWGDKLTHFGCTTTSRAESSNSFLKKFLSSSIHELRKIHPDDMFKRPFFCNGPTHEDVIHKVSCFALRESYEHMDQNTTDLCTKRFSTTRGIPCGHVSRERIQSRTKLSVHDFHLQWHVAANSPDRLESVDSVTCASNIQDAVPLLQELLASDELQHMKMDVVQQIKTTIQSGRGIQMKDPLLVKARRRPLGSTKDKVALRKREPSSFECVAGSS